MLPSHNRTPPITPLSAFKEDRRVGQQRAALYSHSHSGAKGDFKTAATLLGIVPGNAKDSKTKPEHELARSKDTPKHYNKVLRERLSHAILDTTSREKSSSLGRRLHPARSHPAQLCAWNCSKSLQTRPLPPMTKESSQDQASKHIHHFSYPQSISRIETLCQSVWERTVRHIISWNKECPWEATSSRSTRRTGTPQ